MNVSGYGLNVQYQKTQLSYDMTLSKVDPNEKSKELADGNNELSKSNLHVVYMSEEYLNNSEMLSKLLLEATYSQYSSTNSNLSLLPNIKTSKSEDIPDEIKAYGNHEELPAGLVYTTNSEYYEKTSFDFSGEIIIKTPEGEYNIELSLSYTQEFYEKNASFIEIAHEKLKSPHEIELNENNKQLNGLNSIDLLFENTPEDKNTNNFFTQLMESLKERKEYVKALLEKTQEEQMDNYQVYMSKNKESYQLVSAQKEGLGVLFSQTHSESSYVEMGSNTNGSYIAAGYASSQTTTITSFEAKA